MLSAIVIWFMSFNIVMSADKLIYLFGKAAPVLGLTLSMVFRFIPLLQARYREISMGQRCMGRLDRWLYGEAAADPRDLDSDLLVAGGLDRNFGFHGGTRLRTAGQNELSFISYVPDRQSCCSARSS